MLSSIRSIFIIYILLLYGCSTKEESKQIKKNVPLTALDSSKQEKEPFSSSIIEEKKTYDTVLTHTCEHFNLSKQFDMEVIFRRFRNTIEKHDSCAVKLRVRDKQTKKIIDSIFVGSHFYFHNTFMECKNVLSYSTKINTSKQVADNYYGDLIIADLNFDHKDDIVVINDSGGNGGTFYSYFLQDDKKKFVLNNFLTDSMTYFPSEIKSKTHTLTTYVHAGVCGLGEHIYHLDKKTNSWSEKSHRIMNVCEEDK